MTKTGEIVITNRLALISASYFNVSRYVLEVEHVEFHCSYRINEVVLKFYRAIIKSMFHDRKMQRNVFLYTISRSTTSWIFCRKK